MSTILVVDDQPDHRRFLAILLRDFGHKILEAGNGSEALETLRNADVSLVICDVLMPTMDGYEFLRKLRSDRRFECAPVIFYTAGGYESEGRAMAQAGGVRHFFTKPADPKLLLAAVNSALGRDMHGISVASLLKFDRHAMTAPADPIDPKAVVFVVDDDLAIRDSLSEICHRASLQSEAFGNAEKFLDSYEGQPGCLVLALHLPEMSGLAMLETLRSRRIHIPAIILTGHGDMATAVDAMRLGVVDFLNKPTDARILLTRIYRALQTDAIKRRAQSAGDAIRKLMATLTDREKDLIPLMVLGKTSKEIARELHISVKTVSHHRSHLMTKTGAVNLADLVRMSMVAIEK